MNFLERQKARIRTGLVTVLAAPLLLGTAGASVPDPLLHRSVDFGIIKGVIRDNGGSPIADATIAIFRVGTTKLLKQVRSGADGSFIAKVLPGTYTVLAVAQGYNAVTLSEVELNGSAAMTYGFKLERAGGGNTLPEKRVDRNNPKWVMRSAQTSRSIYQNTESDIPVDDTTAVEPSTAVEIDSRGVERPTQTVVESYFAGSKNGRYSGVNVAALISLKDNADLVLVGQTGTGAAPQRFESQLKFRPVDSHQVRISGAIGKLGTIAADDGDRTLGQFSFQATDEWKVREGVILVFGVDYARFIGAGNDFSVSPRFGLQLDLDSKTRFRSAYTAQSESRTWSQAIALEDSQVIFRDPVAVEDFVIEGTSPKMNKSNRLEFGIERVLDNRSTVEANFFLDTTIARGIGFSSMPFDSVGGGLTEFVGNQRGSSQGVRIVYSRRLNGNFTAGAGYSFGRGQSLSSSALTNPAELFQNDFFQSLFGQVEADFGSGTNVKTVFRLSPAATIFAIDPFQGRLAIHDPGLSVLVTQHLPNLGLPFRAQAVVDARNIFDFQTGIYGEEGSLRMNSQGRTLRGAIQLRF